MLVELQNRLPMALRTVAFGSGCAVLVAVCMLLPPLQLIDDWLFDLCFQLRGVRPSNAKVVLVGIDDAWLRSLKKPMPCISPEIAQVVNFLHEEKARAIGIDLIVPSYLEDLPELRTDGKSSGDPSAMRRAVKDAGNVVLIEEIWGDLALKPLHAWYLSSRRRSGPGLPTDLACVELTEDRDFFVRRQGLLYSVPETEDGPPVTRPHLALALASVGENRPAESFEDGRLLLGGAPLGVDSNMQMRINFVGPPGTIPVIPIRDILENRVTDEQRALVHEAMAVVGFTARSVQDFHRTPYATRLWRSDAAGSQELMAGIELHANTLATILDSKFLHRLAWWQEFLLLLAAGIALVGLNVRLGILRGALAALINLAAWQALAVFSLGQWSLQLPLAAVLLVLGSAFAAASSLRWRWSRRLFGAVNARQIAELIERTPGHLALKGEERFVTILFADLRGFSTFSRNQPPKAVIKVLNTYFGAIVPVIERNGGVVNRYLGDGLMVLFNASSPLEDHARKAVEAAVEMVRRIRSMRSTWDEFGYSSLGISVGINTGPVVVALVGSPNRLDYSAYGDSVNAAARIEAENRAQRSEILISSSTWKLLPNHDRERLHCRSAPVTVEVKGVGNVDVHVVDVPEEGI
jgi:class 3 adenylate cyclase